jgi:uncharacterized C2H2 Zn-finger protein
MVCFNCEKCLKEFYKKSNYITHVNKKIPCDIDNKTCQHCDKSFTRTTGLTQHLNVCEVIVGKRKVIEDQIKKSQLECFTVCGEIDFIKNKLFFLSSGDNKLIKQLESDKQFLIVQKNKLNDFINSLKKQLN